MTFLTPRIDNKIPSYETAAIIARKVSGGNFPQHTSAISAGYGAELTAHLKPNNLVKVSQDRAFLSFDKWKSAYPSIPSYATYLANRRNSITGIVGTSTCKSNVSFIAGLKIVSGRNSITGIVVPCTCKSNVSFTAGLKIANRRNSITGIVVPCTCKSNVSFTHNIDLAVRAALNIPISRAYESRDGLRNRPLIDKATIACVAILTMTGAKQEVQANV
jgi:hypothetical protein